MDSLLCLRLFLLGVPVFLGSCTLAEDQSSNEGWATWSVAEPPQIEVGEVEGDPDYIFSRVAAVRLLPAGRIAVADGGAMQIRVYGAEGRLEAEFGARGEGPGEFQSLRTIEFLPPDTILAYDSRATRITKFGTGGTLFSTVQVQPQGGIPEIYVGQTSAGDHVIAWIRFGESDPSVLTPDLMDVGSFDSEGRFIGHLTTMPGMRRLNGPVPFSPHFAASTTGNAVVMSDGMSGTVRLVELRRAGETTIQIPLAPPNLDEAWQELERALQTSEQIEHLRMARESAPDSVPVFSDLLTDDEGHLWLKKYQPATDSHLIGRPRNGGHWIRARLDGSIAAEVVLPSDFQLLDVRDGRLAGVARDALGVESVRVYELVRE